MKLSLDKIREITTGAVRIEENNGTFVFYRFTKEQELLYKNREPDFYQKTFATAGVKFFFQTDSKSLFIKLKLSPGSSRKYFSMDVFVNNKLFDCLDNFSDRKLPEIYPFEEYPKEQLSKSFYLGAGVKTVCVHLPWSMNAVVEEISIDDDSFLKGIKPQKKLLAFGDSITHGYDALRPSNRYVAKIAEKLGAEEINKGIGGERFFPGLTATKEPFEPDYITVAYGTNDWNCIDEKTFRENCRAFYCALSKQYQAAKIFAITPIFRKDKDEERAFGPFENVLVCIRDAVKDLENVSLISGNDFVPESERYFADGYLHPNDAGFVHYAESLYQKIKSEI